MDYPKFPIVFRSNEAEKLGFLHLSIIFCNVSLELILCGGYKGIKKYAKAIPHWIKIPANMPQDFQNLIKIINTDEIDTNKRNFNQAKERLFTTMYQLKKSLGKSQFKPFLQEILKLDQQLTDIFNKLPNNNEEFSKKLCKIKDILANSKDIHQRNSMAKALILDVFNHIDEAPDSIIEKMQALDTVFVCKNYGQMARFINHIQDQEHKHIYRADEYIPLIANKSYFVLGKNETYESFYDKLYDAMLRGDATYGIRYT